MEISFNKGYSYNLVFKADNVHVEEDIEERIYSKGEDGKTDYKTPPFRDISTVSLEQICSILEDMIYYRERVFESTSLIEYLFEKLPQDSVKPLLEKLKKDYED